MPSLALGDDWCGGRTLTTDSRHNRDEWQRLAQAIDLSDGFVFLPVVVDNPVAETQLGLGLAELAARSTLALTSITLARSDGVVPREPQVSDLLATLRKIARPALIWLRVGHEVDFGPLFAHLNQKRDVMASLAAAPVVMSLDARGWERFRSVAPDLWSIHQRVTRLEGAPAVAGSLLASGHWLPPLLVPEVSWVSAMSSNWSRPEHGLVRALHGRAAEQAVLLTEVMVPGARVHVWGPAGAGKTALLHDLACRVEAHFDGGIWWFSYPALAVEGPDRLAALRQRIVENLLVYCVDPYNRAFAGEPLFAHATTIRRTLIILEDVDEDLDLVEGMQIGASSSLVVSSRRASTSTRGSMHGIALANLGPAAIPAFEAGGQQRREAGDLDDAARFAHAKSALAYPWRAQDDLAQALTWLESARERLGAAALELFEELWDRLHHEPGGSHPPAALVHAAWRLAKAEGKLVELAITCEWFAERALRTFALADARTWFEQLATLAEAASHEWLANRASAGLQLLDDWQLLAAGEHMRTWTPERTRPAGDHGALARRDLAARLLAGDERGASERAHAALGFANWDRALVADAHMILALLAEHRGDLAEATTELIAAASDYLELGRLGRAQRTSEAFARVLARAPLDRRSGLREAWRATGLSAGLD